MRCENVLSLITSSTLIFPSNNTSRFFSFRPASESKISRILLWPTIFVPIISKMDGDRDYRAQGNDTWGIEWSHDRWHHVTLNGYCINMASYVANYRQISLMSVYKLLKRIIGMLCLGSVYSKMTGDTHSVLTFRDRKYPTSCTYMWIEISLRELDNIGQTACSFNIILLYLHE